MPSVMRNVPDNLDHATIYLRVGPLAYWESSDEISGGMICGNGSCIAID
jgi:hypothetical protein